MCTHFMPLDSSPWRRSPPERGRGFCSSSSLSSRGSSALNAAAMLPQLLLTQRYSRCGMVNGCHLFSGLAGCWIATLIGRSGGLGACSHPRAAFFCQGLQLNEH